MLKVLTDILWSTAIILLLGGGIYFTIKLKFPQFKFKRMFASLKHKDSKNISPFQSLTMSLAARIGVGSLAGIALAIYIGGPGTIFWIWVTTIFTSVNSFCESYLGAKYQEKDGRDYKGGPAFYIDKGLKNKKLAKLYAIIIIISYVVGFMTIQSNTITKSLEDYLSISPLIIGIILALLSGYIIWKGLEEIVSTTSKMVPVMGTIYLLTSFIIVITNINKVPNIIKIIISDAFNLKSAGLGIISTFIIGIQRGIFSTEAGLGSGAIASSTSNVKDKLGLGLLQILGIYFTSFIICTSTAFIILLSDYNIVNFNDINGIEITQYALKYHLGSIGNVFLIFSILSFAFSTIIAGYYYGESNLKYLIKNIKPYHISIFKIITIILLVFGSITSPTILWAIVDILVAILAIINMYSIIKMRKEIIIDYQNKK